MPREILPSRRPNETRAITFAERQYQVCVGFDLQGQPREVFADGQKQGSDMEAVIDDACVLISIALQFGSTPAELEHSLGRVPRWTEGVERQGPASIIGAIVEVLG